MLAILWVVFLASFAVIGGFLYTVRKEARREILQQIKESETRINQLLVISGAKHEKHRGYVDARFKQLDQRIALLDNSLISTLHYFQEKLEASECTIMYKVRTLLGITVEKPALFSYRKTD